MQAALLFAPSSSAKLLLFVTLSSCAQCTHSLPVYPARGGNDGHHRWLTHCFLSWWHESHLKTKWEKFSFSCKIFTITLTSCWLSLPLSFSLSLFLGLRYIHLVQSVLTVISSGAIERQAKRRIHAKYKSELQSKLNCWKTFPTLHLHYSCGCSCQCVLSSREERGEGRGRGEREERKRRQNIQEDHSHCATLVCCRENKVQKRLREKCLVTVTAWRFIEMMHGQR